jgi:hypothetical protein
MYLIKKAWFNVDLKNKNLGILVAKCTYKNLTFLGVFRNKVSVLRYSYILLKKKLLVSFRVNGPIDALCSKGQMAKELYFWLFIFFLKSNKFSFLWYI